MEATPLTWAVAIAGLVLIGLFGGLQLVAALRSRSGWTIQNVYGGSPDATDPTAYFALLGGRLRHVPRVQCAREHDGGHEPEAAAAVRAFEHVDVETAAHELGPGVIVRAGDLPRAVFGCLALRLRAQS